MSTVQEIKDILKECSDSKGIPVISPDHWEHLSKQYEKNVFRVAFAEYITENSVPFPLRNITKSRLEEEFTKFCNTSHKNMIEYIPHDIVFERFDYRYSYNDYGLGVIKRDVSSNIVSDYFHQENRMRCGSLSSPSPYEIWTDKQKLAKLNYHWWRNMHKGHGIDYGSIRTAIRLGSYIPAQFKPSIAKFLYEQHDAVNVLDTSCGWGDRLAGFFATPSTKLYIGCDPNPAVYEKYKEQCKVYESLLGNGSVITEYDDYFVSDGVKKVVIYNKASEDVDWTEYKNTFDFYFTSPPYYNTEKYSKLDGNTSSQSWFRYNTFESWMYDFFLPLNEKLWFTMKDNSYFMVNIIDPNMGNSKKGRYELCDKMVDHFVENFDNCYFLGKIGMGMSIRPNTPNASLENKGIEPIWVFRKNNQKYTHSRIRKTHSLESMFETT